MISKYELGRTGLHYVQKRLSWGKDNGKALSSYLLELPLHEGHVWTYLPADVEALAIEQLDRGGVLPQQEGFYWGDHYVTPIGGGPVGSALKLKFHSFISEYLRQPDNPFYVLEDENARLGDPWLDSHSGKVFFHGTDVYHFVAPSDNDIETISSAEDNAASLWLCISILTKLPMVPLMQSRVQVTSELLSVMAANTEHIIVEAYDNEANVIWTRNQ